MENKIQVYYLAVIELDGEFISETFRNDSPIQSRKDSIKWLQEQCPNLLDKKTDYKELRVKLMFVPLEGIHSIICYFRIKDRMLLYENEKGINREWVVKNLIYEYEYYQKNKLDDEDCFSRGIPSFLMIDFNLDKKYYIGASVEKIEYKRFTEPFSTGNLQIDEHIQHALKLFNAGYSAFQEKRSACETLGFILEPLRKDLESLFSKKEISTLFSLLNNYKIRHNKPDTKEIEEEEQFDLIFKLLFNTIKAYYTQITRN